MNFFENSHLHFFKITLLEQELWREISSKLVPYSDVAYEKSTLGASAWGGSLATGQMCYEVASPRVASCINARSVSRICLNLMCTTNKVEH